MRWVRARAGIVILKIKWPRILKSIWRMQPSRVGPSLGVSALCVTGDVEFKPLEREIKIHWLK